MEIKKKKIGLAFVFSVLSACTFGQILHKGERAGLIQSTATIYPSAQLNTKGLNIYLGGYFNYHFDNKYSFRGDGQVLMGTQTKPAYIDKNYQILAGFNRYFPVKRFDPYVGIQAGLSMIQSEGRSEMVYNSVFVLRSGLDFLVYRFFYFFIDLQYSHQVDPWHSRPLDQFMGSGGLGFQVPIKNVRQKEDNE